MVGTKIQKGEKEMGAKMGPKICTLYAPVQTLKCTEKRA